MKTGRNQWRELLIESKTIQEFFVRAESVLAKENLHFSYAAFARKAGFSARSHVREIFQGRKLITLETLPRFLLALKMKGREARIFTLLAAQSNLVLCPEFKEESERTAELNKTRKRLAKHNRTQITDANVFQIGDWPDILAAIGSQESPTEAHEISRRLKIDLPTCQRLLQKMTDQKMIAALSGTDKFYVLSSHFHFQSPTLSEPVGSYFVKNAQSAIREAKKGFESSENLFLTSSFSVNAKDLPSLKAELRELLCRYVDESEEGNGNSAATLVCSLFRR